MVRWNPLTGEKLQSIPIPAPLVTSCVFGGVLRDELYITTARTGLSDQQLKDYPLAGAVFKMKMDMKGTESYMFLG
ncbi:SMP-30/Gluconolaconase/LRE-like region [compost metagenome]